MADGVGCARAAHLYGGWGGIRTHETLPRLPVFKTGAFNHSATHPLETGCLATGGQGVNHAMAVVC